tara:strand:+ start:240 stop:1427 length:1188 start_codon:yes stop_codon:yes gene_type:complete
MTLKTGLRVLLFDPDLSSPTLLDDLTSRVQGLRFATALHGGFKFATFSLSASLAEAWEYLAEAGKTSGRHFCRLLISEEQRTIWEGRVTDVRFSYQAGSIGLRISCQGYWGSLRDQFYSDDDGSRTDWTSGSHTADDIIKEMLTAECPSINSDQSNIDANSRDIAGINLSAREYPQDIIIQKLAPLSDSDNSIWHFAVWEDRKPYWKKRSIATLDYRIRLSDTKNLELNQSATEMRNAITPLRENTDGTFTEGTIVANSTSIGFYTRREMLFTLPIGTTANAQADAAGTLSEERGYPVQMQQFVVSGHVYEAFSGTAGTNLSEVPKWRIRAGETLRIDDLVTSTVATPAFDRLRTFHIMETIYDADNDTVSIHPDTSPRTLSNILSNLGNTEAPR